MSPEDVVICNPVRTPVGGFGGSLAGVSVGALAEHCLVGLMERSGVSPDVVDDVLLGHCYPSAHAPALGRVAALDAGLPVTVPGLQIDRRCGSALQAVILASLQVASGGCRVVVAGGAESMSNAPHYSHDIRWGTKFGALGLDDTLAVGRRSAGGKNHPVEGGMLETAENLRAEFSISREAQDAYALRSHERAVGAQERGDFDDEIVPVVVTRRRDQQIVSKDEHPRADTTLERLAALPAVMARQIEGATVTAGNASGQNDGAAMCLVTTRHIAESEGLDIFLRLVSWATTGVEPARMGIGPVSAISGALARADLTLADMDLIEINEAFAAQLLACTAALGMTDGDHDRLNVLGSGISLGHPVGATGVRILATLAREMRRRDGARYCVESLCIGGGQGIAAVFEREAPR